MGEGTHILSALNSLSSHRTIALPLGRRLGVRDKRRPKAQPSATLEGFYKLLGRTPKEVSAPVLRAHAANTSFPRCQPPFWGRRRYFTIHQCILQPQPQ